MTTMADKIELTDEELRYALEAVKNTTEYRLGVPSVEQAASILSAAIAAHEAKQSTQLREAAERVTTAVSSTSTGDAYWKELFSSIAVFVQCLHDPYEQGRA
jgi:hypothetical protein